MSTTIRIQKADKRRLEALAKKSGGKKLTETLRFAISAGEREMEKFEGNPAAIAEALKVAIPMGRRTSERADEALVEALK